MQHKYSAYKVATVLLEGGSHVSGSAHARANEVQNKTTRTQGLQEGTLGIEFLVAEDALNQAKLVQTDLDIVTQLSCARDYFEKIGATDSDLTYKPKLRP